MANHFWSDPLILQGFVIALLFLCALFFVVALDEIAQHRQTRAKYDTLRALWTNKVDLQERLWRMRTGKAPLASAQEIQQWHDMTNANADPRD